MKSINILIITVSLVYSREEGDGSPGAVELQENEDPVLSKRKQHSDSRGGSILASVMKWVILSVCEMVEEKHQNGVCVGHMYI